ncbi:MAG: S9 family peptidase [Chloroflexi bacterium]|nr:S9 family peptidase [Chloroflexota bacterium]
MPTKPKRHLTAEDLYRFNLITDARIAPDGRAVITAVQRIDPKTEKKFSNLWLAPTGPGRPQQFTYGDQVDTSPRWSPDGRTIAFLSNRQNERQMQVYLIPVNGGEARPLTSLKGQFGSLDWSPDGRRLLCTFRKPDKAALERESDEQKKKLGVVARHVTSRTFFKMDGEGYLPDERWHIWTIDAQNGKATQLTDSENHDEVNPVWSPDGRFIAFTSNRQPDPDQTPDRDDVYVIPAEGGEMRLIPTPVGPLGALAYSPDGRALAYLGVDGEGQWWRNVSLWIVGSDVDGAPARNLTAAADLHCVDVTSGDMAGGVQMPPTWANDGQSIFFQASRHGDTALYRATLDGQPAIERLLPDPGQLGPYTWDAAQQKMAYVLNTMTRPGELYVWDRENGRSRQLSRFNENWLKRLHLGQIEEVWFKAYDGYDLHGWILFPPDFDPAQTYPSILQIHGGPQVQYGNAFMHEFFFLAAHGYVVYFSNPRGGQGYGDEHSKAIWHNWGTVDYDDVMAWTDYMAGQSYIDVNRMGVTGGSYGGYMTSMIIGRTQRFKAAVTQRSVNNLVSMWGSSDFNWAFQQTIGQDKPPFDNLEQYWRLSPMKYIGNAQTPTLVIHSQADYRVAQEQGEQVFVALKRLGVDTELVLFPDEPHGLSRVGRTDRRIVRLNHILRWFEKYLK